MPSRVDDVGKRERAAPPMHPLLKVVLVVLFSALFLLLILWRGG